MADWRRHAGLAWFDEGQFQLWPLSGAFGRSNLLVRTLFTGGDASVSVTLEAEGGLMAGFPPTTNVHRSADGLAGFRQLVMAEGVLIDRDVAYLPVERAEKLDLYLPAGRSAQTLSPAVVIIHGGGWTGGSKSAAREFEIGTTLAKAGYVCASVEYLKSGPERWPTNLKDCKNAVRFLRHSAVKYQIDEKNIGVLGGSAGGHLALMVAYTTGVKPLSPEAPYPGVSDAVRACVDLYGITDLLTRQGTEPDGTPNGILRDAGLFPDKRGENLEKWRLASPVNYITSNSPPTLILHGAADTTVDREQSVQLARRLSEHGVAHQLVIIPGVGHTFDLEHWQRKPLPQDLRPLVLQFFNRYLKADAER